jgi:hypothetical protein
VYSLDLKDGFKLRGDVTHLTRDDILKSGYYGGNMERYVQRMLYIGDTFYTASQSIIKANDLKDLKVIKEISLK